MENITIESMPEFVPVITNDDLKSDLKSKSKYSNDTDFSIDEEEMQKYYNMSDYGFYSKTKEDLLILSQKFNDVDEDINTTQLETDNHNKSFGAPF